MKVGATKVPNYTNYTVSVCNTVIYANHNLHSPDHRPRTRLLTFALTYLIDQAVTYSLMHCLTFSLFYPPKYLLTSFLTYVFLMLIAVVFPARFNQSTF